MSPFQMLVAAPVVGPIGERVITFFRELGKLDGWISDVSENGFLLDIAVTRKVRERLAKKLAWLQKKQKEAVVDVRGQQRVVPENPHTNLIFADGTTLNCFVIDVSPSGAAVSADVDTEIGTRLSVGRSVGHVIRHFDEGFAVHFDRLHDPSSLEKMIRPPSDMSVYRSPLEVPPQRIYLDAVPKEGEVSCDRVAALPQQKMWLVD
ncbi:MAG: hypothetical protein QOD74_1118 [Variibacter sp.]|jgi:hypothetical protein|nr:hypothetical protein [Variibacter sp.]